MGVVRNKRWIIKSSVDKNFVSSVIQVQTVAQQSSERRFLQISCRSRGVGGVVVWIMKEFEEKSNVEAMEYNYTALTCRCKVCQRPASTVCEAALVVRASDALERVDHAERTGRCSAGGRFRWWMGPLSSRSS